ncbi:WXG100 family type VII secretion target [Catellatospora sp. TT07R-123]|uniref:WXG100 family type VII secretion target n=1 Tax=Catellatospora sp. TT07R-123 TaxID=2733863 RepID=UPI001BB2EED8|nr:type VII secretion target [Catellatospora sp. TT07R-123]
MDVEFDDGNAPQPVRVDPHELVRIAARLADLAGAMSRDVPRTADLTASPEGWSVRSAQVRLMYEVNAHLTGLSTALDGYAQRLRTAAAEYSGRDERAADVIAAAGGARIGVAR